MIENVKPEIIDVNHRGDNWKDKDQKLGDYEERVLLWMDFPDFYILVDQVGKGISYPLAYSPCSSFAL